MDDHQHDYMQIDKLYSTQNKLVDFYCDALIIKNFEINYNKPIIENVELLHDLYVIKPTNPEISILNCCFIC